MCLAAIAACKRDKPEKQAPPGKAETPGKGNGSGPTAAPDLDLPKGPGTPPIKTTGPLTAKQLVALGEIKFPRFTNKPHGLNDTFVEVRQITNDFPKIMATITIATCGNTLFFDCRPLELAKWKESTRLKDILVPELRDLPDTVWELKTNTLYGQTIIETYQLAFLAQNPKGHGAWSHAVALYYNDGINQIRVVAQYADDPAARETIVKKVPREDLELVAKAFMDVYTHAWTAAESDDKPTPTEKAPPTDKK